MLTILSILLILINEINKNNLGEIFKYLIVKRGFLIKKNKVKKTSIINLKLKIVFFVGSI